MNLPDADTVRALTNLSGTPEFQLVLRWMSRTLEEDTEALISSTEPVRIHQLQGMCSQLVEFMQAVRSANPSLTLPTYLG